MLILTAGNWGIEPIRKNGLDHFWRHFLPWYRILMLPNVRNFIKYTIKSWSITARRVFQKFFDVIAFHHFGHRLGKITKNVGCVVQMLRNNINEFIRSFDAKVLKLRSDSYKSQSQIYFATLTVPNVTVCASYLKLTATLPECTAARQSFCISWSDLWRELPLVTFSTNRARSL